VDFSLKKRGNTKERDFPNREWKSSKKRSKSPDKKELLLSKGNMRHLSRAKGKWENELNLTINQWIWAERW